MSKREPRVALRHMLEYAREALSIIEGKDRSDLDHDRLLSLALSRLLEIIGEAANRVPPDEQELHPQIEWRKITDMRNRLIHGYDLLDYDIVWETAVRDLPRLTRALEDFLPPDDAG